MKKSPYKVTWVVIKIHSCMQFSFLLTHRLLNTFNLLENLHQVFHLILTRSNSEIDDTSICMISRKKTYLNSNFLPFFPWGSGKINKSVTKWQKRSVHNFKNGQLKVTRTFIYLLKHTGTLLLKLYLSICELYKLLLCCETTSGWLLGKPKCQGYYHITKVT